MFQLIVSLVILLTAFWWVLAHWGLRTWAPERTWPRWLLAAFCLFQLGYIGYRFLSRRQDWAFDPPVVVSVLGYVWHLVVVPLVVVPLLAGTLVLLAWLGSRALWRKLRRAPVSLKDSGEWEELDVTAGMSSEAVALPEEAAAPSAITRRQFLGLAVAAAPPALMLLGAGAALPNLQSVGLRRLTIPIAGLPSALEGLRIAHLSDLHVGRFTSTKALARMVELTMAEQPGLVVVTGDVIDSQLKDLPQATAALRDLVAPHGVYVCEGNHDLFESREGFRDGVREAGLRILLNEWETANVDGQRLRIGGLAWGRSGVRRGASLEENMEELLDGHDRSAALSLLLAHHPHAFDNAAAEGIHLTFAGHTHGGQLMLSENLGAGPMMFKYWSGLYRNAAASLVVSNGVGNWMPLRVNAPPEVIVATLTRA